ncbi:MAG: DUF2085 domain-containing protein [Sandaracinus sp.]|nr:DUF2085 domain-containing protein [Sandaracinus sp.]
MLASVLIAAARPHDVGSLAIRTVFSRACHQNPERSFAWAGEPFCICHRCFGIYAGLAVGALLAALWPRLPLDPGSRRVWSVALVPMLVHVALLNLWSPADLVFLRVGTGALFGFNEAVCRLRRARPSHHASAVAAARNDREDRVKDQVRRRVSVTPNADGPTRSIRVTNRQFYMPWIVVIGLVTGLLSAIPIISTQLPLLRLDAPPGTGASVKVISDQGRRHHRALSEAR